jgi:hypothetical protein
LANYERAGEVEKKKAKERILSFASLLNQKILGLLVKIFIDPQNP